MKSAFAENRPFLMISLLFGISYYFACVLNTPELPEPLIVLWKGAGVSFLAIYALVRLHRLDGKIVGAFMAFGALGDMALEYDMIIGAGAFMVGHFLAIAFYSRYRRHKLGFSQKLFAILLVPLSIGIAWALPSDRGSALTIALYCLSVAGMAAMAWTSRFSRYQVGAGAILFLVSDLLIFARMGPLETSIIPDLFIWPFYYFGQFMIATGIVRTLRHEMAADSADPVHA
ncbi:lysoplasmalogenase [Parasphingorhabdus sp.]|uniref:lysoplasmalogenase n=1 Tax=Parasphingorhabdus sp. TaxID=2709688 RepID=UPI003A8DA0E6